MDATFTITCIGADESQTKRFTDLDEAERYFKVHFEELCKNLGAAPFIFAENYDFREDEDGCKIIYPAIWRDGEKVYPL